MAKKVQVKKGPPNREERREQQMADSFATLAEAMKVQAETNAALIANLKNEPEAVQARTLDPVDEFHAVSAPPPPNVPVVIYKSSTRGFKQLLVQARIIQRSEGNYQIVPPVFAEFDNATLRVAASDTEKIALIDAAIEKRAQQLRPPVIRKLEGKVAEELADPKMDVKAIGDQEAAAKPEMPAWAV